VLAAAEKGDLGHKRHESEEARRKKEVRAKVTEAVKADVEKAKLAADVARNAGKVVTMYEAAELKREARARRKHGKK